MSAKEALSDYSEIFQENFDRIDKEESEIRDSFKKLNDWLRKKLSDEQKEQYEEKNVVYQYLPETQSEFIDIQSKISQKLEAVFVVVKDINEISAVGTSTYKKAQDIMSEGETPQGSERQVINFNQQQQRQPLIKNPFRRREETNIPKSVEDFWIRSENWKEEIMNYPNIWGKLITYHHYGVIRQKIFDGDGMDDYLENEIVYLNTRVEPNLDKLIKRSLEITRKEVIEGLQAVYTTTQQAEHQMEMARIQTGQETQG